LREPMLAEFSKAKSRPTCRSFNRPSSNWSSILRLLGHSASPYPQPFSLRQRKLSNKGFLTMRRRDFLGVVGGAAAWPLAARGQQPKRVGVLMGGVATDVMAQSNLATFMQGLRKLGWIEGQNLQTEVRWSAGDSVRMETYASDL